MMDGGCGTITRRPTDGVWIGAYETTLTGVRHRRKVSSQMFCKMLVKYSQLQPVHATGTRRRENLEAGRQIATHTAAEWQAKLRGQAGICYYCGKRGYARRRRRVMGRWVWWPQLVMDHMTPLARGGSDGIDNIVGACDQCNCRKGLMTASEYLDCPDG